MPVWRTLDAAEAFLLTVLLRRYITYRAWHQRFAAIPPEEDATSINAAIALRTTFTKESPVVRALFDALVDLLSGSRERKH